ncbi:LysM peptidoglycan-binding domain-containing protein, partial [Thioclava dalianensis]
MRLILVAGVAATTLAACDNQGFDMDMRRFGKGGLDTTDAARQAVQDRPQPDSRGIITYPNYQVVVANRDETVTAVAQRIGVDPGALARYNAVAPNTVLNAGAVLALPTRVAAGPTANGTAGVGTNPSALTAGTIDITSLANNAINKSQGSAQPASATPSPAATA